MKVIHIPFCFYPDPVGGTEVYVESLAQRLRQRGVKIVITAPGERTEQYKHNGLAVRRFAISSELNDIRDLYGEGDRTAAQEFARILDEERPDIVHMHAFTRGVSLRLVREVKRRGINVVFTYHTPTISCQRGTLLRWGIEVCDGELNVRACAACTLHSRGMSKTGSKILSNLPSFIGRLVSSAGLSGGAWTAMRMSELVGLRHSAFHSMMQEVDQVVALCQWTKELLARNNVPAEKITVSRHGLFLNNSRITPQAARSPLPIRIAFFGRMDRTKGPDVLIRALRSLPNASVELHLYGIVQDASNTEYFDQLKQLAEADSRISFLPAVPGEQVVSLLQNYHLLAVPSRWLETGPLVVLEAFAAGTPVIGSKLGGIAELITHDVNGALVEPDSVESWRQAIHRFCEDRTLLHRLKQGIRPPRDMSSVAQEMLLLYERITGIEPVHQIPGSPMESAYANS
jgi:glycosyltransferase involved in cell wall biosynthesis